MGRGLSEDVVHVFNLVNDRESDPRGRKIVPR